MGGDGRFRLGLVLLLGLLLAASCERVSDLELRPSREILRSDGGVLETWDVVRAFGEGVHYQGARLTVNERGLVLPKYADSATIAYVEQGEGIVGLLTGYALGESVGIRRVFRGDAVAIPRGVAHWFYNPAGNADLRIIALSDTSASLDGEYTPFHLAGAREDSYGGILHGFRAQFLGKAWGVEQGTVEELLRRQTGQGIVRVERDLAINLLPESNRRESVFVGEIGEFQHEFVYNVREGAPEIRVHDAGRFNSVNRLKLPILKYTGLGMTHGLLERNALIAPNWSPSGHRVVHILRGSGFLEIAGNSGERLVSKGVEAGEVYAIPRFFPAGLQAGDEGLEWISFHTTDEPLLEALAGKTNVLSFLPEEVAATSFNVDVKFVRQLRSRLAREAFLIPGRR